MPTYTETDRADFLATSRDDKLNYLSRSRDAKINRHSGDDYQNLSNSFTTDEGYTESNKNKIWNQLSDKELQYLVGEAAAKEQVLQDDQGLYQLIDGQRVPFDGEARRLYGYGSKGEEDLYKAGVARGDLPSSDYRYQPGREEGYGWESGPKGVDIEQKYMDLLLPAETVTTLEGLIHGREDSLSNRALRRPIEPTEDFYSDKEALGSGYTEYYKGGPTGVFGDSRDDASFNKQTLWEQFQKQKETGTGFSYTPDTPSKQPNTFESLKNTLLQRESGGDYQAVNDLGYVGGYQFGAQALETLGYVKPGTYSEEQGNKGLGNPDNWTGKGGVNSLDDFLSSKDIQDTAYQENLETNYAQLEKSGLIKEDTPVEDIAGYLAASHLLGAKGAENLENTDKYGTSGLEYFSLGKEAVAGDAPISTTSSQEPISIADYYTEYAQQREADRMDSIDRAQNMVAAFGSTLAKEAGIDFVDWVGEFTKIGDLATEEEKTQWANDAFGYNAKVLLPEIEKAKELSSNILKNMKQEDTDEGQLAKDVFNLVKVGVKNPEFLGQSLGFVASLFVPVLGWGGKVKNAGKATEALNKGIKVLQKNAGLLQVAAGNVNDQVDAYKEEHGEDPSVGKVSSMMATETLMLGLEKLADVSILRSPAMLKEFKGALKAIPGAKLPKGEKSKIALKGAAIAAGLTANMGKEAGQEYLQSMGEILNVKLNLDDNDNLESIATEAGDILVDKDTLEEGIMSAGLGAGGAIQFAGAGATARGLSALGQKVNIFRGDIREGNIDKSVKEAETERQDILGTIKTKAEDSAASINKEELDLYINDSLSTKERTRRINNIERQLVRRSKDLIADQSGKEDVTSDGVLRLGADERASKLLNDVELVASERGDVRQLDRIKSIANEELGIDPTSIDEAVKAGKALFSLKGTGVTGKESKQVREEVTTGPSGFITFYNNAKAGLISGNSDIASKNIAQLESFIAHQKDKLDSLNSGLNAAESQVRSEVDRLVSQEGFTQEQALRNIMNRNTTTEATWGTKGRAHINHNVVAENILTGGRTAESGASTYGYVNSVNKELADMQTAYNALARSAGLEPITPEEPSTQEPELEPVDTTETSTETIPDTTTTEEVSEARRRLFKGANQKLAKYRQGENVDWKEVKLRIEALPEETYPRADKEAVYTYLRDEIKTINADRKAEPKKPSAKPAKEDVTKTEKEVSISESLKQRTMHEKGQRSLASIQILRYSDGSGEKKYVPDLYKISTTTSVNSVDVKNTSEGIQDYVNNFIKSINSAVVKPALDANGRVKFSDNENDIGRLFLFNDDGSINSTTALAMATSALEFVSENYTDIAKPRDEQDIRDMFGIEEEQAVSPNLLHRLENGGMRGSLAFSNAGKSVVSKLGVSLGKGSKIDMAALENSLGAITLMAAQEQGFIKDMFDTDNVSFVNKDMFADAYNPNAVQTLVIGTDNLGERLGDFRDLKEALAEELSLDMPKNTYSFTPPEKSRRISIRRQGFITPNEEHTKAINKLEKTPFKLNSGLSALLDMFGKDGVLDREALKTFLKEDEKEALTKDSMESRKSKNNKISVLVDEFADLVESAEEDASVYFDWFVAKNMRLHLDSATVNPQDDKTLSRWLLTTADSRTSIEKSLINDYLEGKNTDEKAAMFVYSVVQAFDGVLDVAVDKGAQKGSNLSSEDTIRKTGKMLLRTDKEELYNKIREGVDHPGHALLAISNIEKYKEAEDSFESDMVLEVDGITNGLAFRTLQIPLSNPAKWLSMTGSLLKGSDYYKLDNMNEASRAGLDDSYIAGGRDVVDAIEDIDFSTTPDMKAVDDLMIALEAVPKEFDLDDPSSKGYSFIRNLLKPPMMVFNYAAGSKSINRKLVSSQIDNVINRLYRASRNLDSEEGKILKSTTNDRFIKGLRKLSNKSFGSTDADVTYVRELLEKYYSIKFGNPVVTMLESEFQEQTEVNGQINDAMVIMHQAFKEKFDADEVVTMTEEGQNRWLKNNIDLVPGFFGYNTLTEDQKVAILKTAISEESKTYGFVATKNTKSKNKQLLSYPSIREYADPGVAANPIAVHAMDSSTMTRVLNNIDKAFLAIHDAAIIGIEESNTSKRYNEEFYKINRDYSMVEAITDSLKKLQQDKRFDNGSLVVAKRIDSEEVHLTINDIIDNLDDTLKTINNTRNQIFSTDMKVGQMAGVIGSMYEVDAKKEINDAIDGIIDDTKNTIEQFNIMPTRLSNALKNKAYNTFVDESLDTLRKFYTKKGLALQTKKSVEKLASILKINKNKYNNLVNIKNSTGSLKDPQPGPEVETAEVEVEPRDTSLNTAIINNPLC